METQIKESCIVTKSFLINVSWKQKMKAGSFQSYPLILPVKFIWLTCNSDFPIFKNLLLLFFYFFLSQQLRTQSIYSYPPTGQLSTIASFTSRSGFKLHLIAFKTFIQFFFISLPFFHLLSNRCSLCLLP